MTETVADETAAQPSPAQGAEATGLKVAVEPLEGREVRLTIEVGPERVEAALREAAHRLSQQVRIPGFRKGKAPFAIMLRYIGQEALLEEALEPLTEQVYQEALKLTGIEPFAPGRLEDVRTEPPLTLEMIVPLAPLVDLGDYRALRMEPPKAEVSDDVMKEALDSLREQHAVLEPANRPAQLGDMVTVTLRGRVDGKVVLRGDEVDILLDPAADQPGPGFANEMIGAVPNQERTFTLHYPEDDPNADLAGRDVQFRVAVHKVQSRYIPPLDDEFARSLDDEHIQTALDLRIRLRQRLQESLQRRADAEFGHQVLDQIITNARIEYPPILLEREIDMLLESIEMDLRSQRHLTLDDFLKLQGKTRAAYREEIRPRAELRLKRSLALTEIIKLEGLEVSPEEVKKEIDEMSAPLGERAEDFRRLLSTPAQQRHIEADLLTDKAFERLVQIAQGLAPPSDQGRTTQDAAPASSVLRPGAAEGPPDQPNETPTILVP